MMSEETALTRRYKIMLTIGATTLVAVAAMAIGETEIASAAAGALFGYLGKMNGYDHDENQEDA